MPSNIEKINNGRYRFTCDADGIDVIFTRENFREVLEGFGYSSKRIGHVVKLINKVDPLPVRPRTTPYDLAHYSETFLIEYMKKKGYNVYKRIPVSDEDIIFWLNSKGYTVSNGSSLEMHLASGDDQLNKSSLLVERDERMHT